MLRRVLLLWLWGRLGVLTQGTPAGTAPTKDVVDLEFYTKRLFQSVSPSFLSITIDASLATDPRFLTFLG